MEEDFELLFHEAILENTVQEEQTLAEKVVSRAEEEFKGYSQEETSRQNEETIIKDNLKKLQYQLKKCGNIKNPRLRHLNKQRAEKRRKLKKEIADYQLRLQEINVERPKIS